MEVYYKVSVLDFLYTMINALRVSTLPLSSLTKCPYSLNKLICIVESARIWMKLIEIPLLASMGSFWRGIGTFGTEYVQLLPTPPA